MGMAERHKNLTTRRPTFELGCVWFNCTVDIQFTVAFRRKRRTLNPLVFWRHPFTVYVHNNTFLNSESIFFFFTVFIIVALGAFLSTQNSGNIGWYIKWDGPFRFGPTGIFMTSFEGGPLWTVKLSRMSLYISQNCCPQYRSFVSRLQYQ